MLESLLVTNQLNCIDGRKLTLAYIKIQLPKNITVNNYTKINKPNLPICVGNFPFGDLCPFALLILKYRIRLNQVITKITHLIKIWIHSDNIKYQIFIRIYLSDSCLHLRLAFKYPLVLLGLKFTPDITFVPPVIYCSSCNLAMHFSTFKTYTKHHFSILQKTQPNRKKHINLHMG